MGVDLSVPPEDVPEGESPRSATSEEPPSYDQVHTKKLQRVVSMRSKPTLERPSMSSALGMDSADASDGATSAGGNSASRGGSGTSAPTGNWLAHTLFVRKQYDACLEEIELRLEGSLGLDHNLMRMKGVVLSELGRHEEALQLFEGAVFLRPFDVQSMKWVARSNYKLGRLSAALKTLESARKIASDWEVLFLIGMCFDALGDTEQAEHHFQESIKIDSHACTHLALGRLFSNKGFIDEAIESMLLAARLRPKDAEAQVALGMLLLQKGESGRAFEFLERALQIDYKNMDALIAVGSVIQDRDELDAALIKYRTGAVIAPETPELWNNVGMCFFGKRKFVAAIASLKRAVDVSPLDCIVNFNLGLAHLVTGQNASAFHFLSATTNLNPGFAPAMSYLGVALHRLDDTENAIAAYEKAIEIEIAQNGFADGQTLLNFAVLLHNHGDIHRAKALVEQVDDLLKSPEGAATIMSNQQAELLHKKLKRVLQSSS